MQRFTSAPALDFNKLLQELRQRHGDLSAFTAGGGGASYLVWDDFFRVFPTNVTLIVGSGARGGYEGTGACVGRSGHPGLRVSLGVLGFRVWGLGFRVQG